VGIRARQPKKGEVMLLLDSEAISAMAFGPAASRTKVRALIQEMRARELPIATVSAILSEVVRGKPRDAGVFAGLRRERVKVYPVDSRVGVRAGRLLGSVGAGSEMAVDAFTVAVGDLEGGAVIATTDARDLRRLAGYAERVTIADVT
jgi:predicted nucleic acid-binding protein